MMRTESRTTACAVVQEICCVSAVCHTASGCPLLKDWMTIKVLDEGDCLAVLSVRNAGQKLVIDNYAKAQRLIVKAEVSHECVWAVEAGRAGFARDQSALKGARLNLVICEINDGVMD